jgi:hypothetical protein
MPIEAISAADVVPSFYYEFMVLISFYALI